MFAIVVPIVLAPYLSRRLGVAGTGAYSYTYSIVYYFMLFAMLGVNNYGSRAIAKCKGDKALLSKKFCEIYSIQLVLGVLVGIAYFLFLLIAPSEYSPLFIIQALFVASAAIDINWFFYGLEEFRITVPRSFVVRIINFVLIIALVKTPDDLWKYALIMAGTAFVNQAVLWPFLLRKISITKPTRTGIKKHLAPLLLLFIPVIAVSLYKIMDKIMLGALSNVDNVGLYEYAEKINSIPLVIISALGTVMLPKISSIIEDKDRVNIYLRKASEFVLFMTVPLLFLFILIGPTFIPFYLGESFSGSALLVIILSSTLPFVSIANVMRTQFLIPAEKDRIYIHSVMLGALLNLLANFILIPIIGSLGACIGTLLAEISVMLFQAISIRNEIALRPIVALWVKNFAISSTIFLICLPVCMLDASGITKSLLQLIVFGALYLCFQRKYILKLLRKEKKNA